jgi:deoxycytidine triphosphate deaminase
MNSVNVRRFPRGGVLSDQDIREMVKKFPDFIAVDSRPINFDGEEKDSLTPCGVDLTIGKIYAYKEKKIEEKSEKGQTLRLPAGGYAHIESKEKFNMPDNIMGFLVQRNSFSERGLLMLNAGHVDPGWKGNGCLTLDIVNLSDEPIDLIVGEHRPFSIIFQYMNTSTKMPTEAIPEEERRHKALGRLERSPRTLFSTYSKELEEKFVTSDQVDTKKMTTLTILVVALSTAIAIAGGLAIVWAFLQGFGN